MVEVGRRAGHRACWILLALVLSGPTWAQGDPSDYREINLGKEGLTLAEAVEWAAKDTGKSFLFGTKRTLEAKTIFLAGIHRVRRDKLYEFWQSVFVTQGFAIIPMGPDGGEFLLVEAIDSSRILKQRARYVAVEELPGLQRRAGEVIMTTIALRHVQVANVRQAVTLILQNRQAEFTQEVASANALIVVGFAPTVFAISQLVTAMDVPSPTATLTFEKIELKHAVAEELQPIISDLISTGATGGAAGAQPAVRRPGQNLLPGQEKPEPKIISDPRTNSLVVYSVQSDLDEIKRLVSFLDTEETTVESNIRIYYLKNTNADEISDTLRELLGQNSTRSGRPTGVRGARGQQPSNTTIAAGQEVTIVPDVNTNALLISCTKSKYAEVEQLIEELDRRRPQVLVQAVVAELSDTDLKNLSVELTGVQGGDPRYRAAGVTGFGLSTIGIPDGGGITDAVRIPSVLGASSPGLVAGLIQGSNVPLLVNLLKRTTTANLMSVPSVLTNDNERSTLTVGEEVPIPSTAIGNVTTQTSFNYEEANLELTISPHISSDGYIRLEIELTVDAFIFSETADGTPPSKTTRSFTGSVTVPDGKTAVIGGLIQDDFTENETGVPYLMDIPLLGHLFKSHSRTYTKKTLYLFVTPSIFTTFKQLEDASYTRKLEIAKINGNIHLVDPNFRTLDLDDPDLELEDLSSSGLLDLPQYVPVQTSKDPASPNKGMPFKPQLGKEAAVVPPGGTRVFINGAKPKGSATSKPSPKK